MEAPGGYMFHLHEKDSARKGELAYILGDSVLHIPFLIFPNLNRPGVFGHSECFQLGEVTWYVIILTS